jgi:hypothetical protein
LQEILTRLRRMASVTIISDFCMPDFSRELSLLRQHHEVFAVRVTDPREEELPDVGLIELEDAETGEQILVDTSDELFREQYRQAVSEADKQICAIFRRSHVPMELVRTTDDWLIPLQRLFLPVPGAVMR